MASWPRTLRRPTSSYFRAGRTPSAWCSSKRWRAAFRSPLFRSRVPRTWSAAILSGFCTKTWAWPASRRFEFLARRVGRSRWSGLGKTARVNSSGIFRKWRATDIANPTREWRWRRPCAADEATASLTLPVTGRKRLGKRRECMSVLSRAELDKEMIAKAYARWAPVYDLVFGAVFERGRHAAIAAAERIGGRILEVGVGTGISLPDYSRSNRLCGVDISEPMLRKAQQRVVELGLPNVEGLWVMDAEHLSFPDASFDVVVAQYVITTVPNREATLDEFARVLKPGGEIVLVSRVGAEAGLRRALERWFASAARKLGWRTEFSWERYADWAERCRGMRLVERRAMPPFGHFSLIRFSKAGGTSAARAAKPSARAAV